MTDPDQSEENGLCVFFPNYGEACQNFQRQIRDIKLPILGILILLEGGFCDKTSNGSK